MGGKSLHLIIQDELWSNFYSSGLIHSFLSFVYNYSILKPAYWPDKR